MDDLVREKLQEITDEGEHYTFAELVKALAQPGDCLDCVGKKVKTALVKLIEAGVVALSIYDGT